MTKDDAVKRAREYLYLVGKKFRLPDSETETIKTVVAWDEGNDNWQPHVCFYDWNELNTDGVITHLHVDEFRKKYQPVE